MCTDETDPQIEANAAPVPAQIYDEVIATAHTLRQQCEEAAAFVKATRAQLEMYRGDAETLGRVKKELRDAGQPVAAPDLTVRELCESEKHLREGVAIWRKLLDGMGFTTGSIPERLKAIETALKSSKITRPLEVPGYYDIDLTPGDEGCLSKDDSRINAWKRSMARACRVLDYYGIPASMTDADGNPRILYIDERVQLLAQQLNRQPDPAKAPVQKAA